MDCAAAGCALLIEMVYILYVRPYQLLQSRQLHQLQDHRCTAVCCMLMTQAACLQLSLRVRRQRRQQQAVVLRRHAAPGRVAVGAGEDHVRHDTLGVRCKHAPGYQQRIIGNARCESAPDAAALFCCSVFAIRYRTVSCDAPIENEAPQPTDIMVVRADSFLLYCSAPIHMLVT
jgi:hypothetical protein